MAATKYGCYASSHAFGLVLIVVGTSLYPATSTGSWSVPFVADYIHEDVKPCNISAVMRDEPLTLYKKGSVNEIFSKVVVDSGPMECLIEVVGGPNHEWFNAARYAWPKAKTGEPGKEVEVEAKWLSYGIATDQKGFLAKDWSLRYWAEDMASSVLLPDRPFEETEDGYLVTVPHTGEGWIWTKEQLVEGHFQGRSAKYSALGGLFPKGDVHFTKITFGQPAKWWTFNLFRDVFEVGMEMSTWWKCHLKLYDAHSKLSRSSAYRKLMAEGLKDLVKITDSEKVISCSKEGFIPDAFAPSSTHSTQGYLSDLQCLQKEWVEKVAFPHGSQTKSVVSEHTREVVMDLPQENQEQLRKCAMWNRRMKFLGLEEPFHQMGYSAYAIWNEKGEKLPYYDLIVKSWRRSIAYGGRDVHPMAVKLWKYDNFDKVDGYKSALQLHEERQVSQTNIAKEDIPDTTDTAKADITNLFASKSLLELVDGKRVKCCCMSAPYWCVLQPLRKPHRGLFDLVWDPEGCGTLLAKGWHSHIKMKTAKCIVHKSEAEKLRKRVPSRDEADLVSKKVEM